MAAPGPLHSKGHAVATLAFWHDPGIVASLVGQVPALRAGFVVVEGNAMKTIPLMLALLLSGSNALAATKAEDLVRAATTRPWPGKNFPELPPLPGDIVRNVAGEIESAAAIRKAYEALDAANRRNVEWFAGLEELEKQKATWSVLSCLCHPSDDVQILALRALGRLKDGRTLPFLLTYAAAMAFREPGSENATLHGIIHQDAGKALAAITGLKIVLKEGQDPEGLKAAIAACRARLASGLNNEDRYRLLLARVKASEEGRKQDEIMRLYALKWAQDCMRQYREAEETSNRLIDLAGKSAGILVDKSCYVGKQGRFEDALELAEEGLALAPDDLRARMVRAIWLGALKRQGEVAKILAEAAVPRIDDKNHNLYWLCKAYIMARLNDEPATQAAIQECMRSDADHWGYDCFQRDVTFDPFRRKQWFIELVGKTMKE